MKVECKTISELEDLRKLHWQGKANPEFQYRGVEVGYLINPGVIYPTPMGQAIMPNLMHAFLYRGQNKDYPRSDAHKKIKGLISEGKIRIIDLDGNIITAEEFIATINYL